MKKTGFSRCKNKKNKQTQFHLSSNWNTFRDSDHFIQRTLQLLNNDAQFVSRSLYFRVIVLSRSSYSKRAVCGGVAYRSPAPMPSCASASFSPARPSCGSCDWHGPKLSRNKGSTHVPSHRMWTCLLAPPACFTRELALLKKKKKKAGIRAEPCQLIRSVLRLLELQKRVG